MHLQLGATESTKRIHPTQELSESAGAAPEETRSLDKPFQHRTLAERAVKFGGNLKLSEEISHGVPQGDEVW